MTPEEALRAAERDHVPVLLREVIEALAPAPGQLIVDATLGAGGYTRAFLEAGSQVIAIDRDPDALRAAADWGAEHAERLRLHSGTFGAMEDALADDERADAVGMDIGVSSMQLDQAERGFSFLRDGPLDMRMQQDGPSATDVVNTAQETELADIFFQYGEERRARALAAAVCAARDLAPIRRTLHLAEIVERASPRKKPGQPHPATRVFQALRIAVNDELGELARGLAAAERVLKSPGGRLAVVTFHSLEDRIVKRFFAARCTKPGAGVSRHAPMVQDGPEPSFALASRKPILPSSEEIARNPRARSAKLRVGIRTAASPHPFSRDGLGLPSLAKAQLGGPRR